VPELVVLAEQLLAPVPGGTGRYTRELLTAMARTAPANWKITAVTAFHRGSTLDARMLPLPRRALVAAWERGIRLWPGGDVVHAPTPLAPPAPKRPLVVTVHDTVPFTHPETLTPRGAAWHQAMIRRATHQASAIVVPTAAVAAELREHASGPAPVHVIPHGVTPLEGDADVSLPDRYVLALGTVEPRKGLDVLVKAMREVNLPLVVVGPRGWGSVALEGAHVLGRLTDAELATVLRRATVLAVPSLAEGFGLPVIEAMAAGVPVVHSDAPALVEVAGGAGVVAPRGDPTALAEALRTVIEDTAKAASLVAAGRARAAGFTWENAAKSHWELHLDLANPAR
jgi:glycosyltransferase involved in cell wall biosynthesis